MDVLLCIIISPSLSIVDGSSFPEAPKKKHNIEEREKVEEYRGEASRPSTDRQPVGNGAREERMGMRMMMTRSIVAVKQVAVM